MIKSNNKMIFRISLITLFSAIVLLSSCSKEDESPGPICVTQVYDNLPDIEASGISYPTTPSLEVPANIQWGVSGSAKEIINNDDYKVYLGAGPQAMPDNVWDTYQFDAPWSKNIDRFLHIDSTALLRSPSASSTCQGINCFAITQFFGYSWYSSMNCVKV